MRYTHTVIYGAFVLLLGAGLAACGADTSAEDSPEEMALEAETTAAESAAADEATSPPAPKYVPKPEPVAVAAVAAPPVCNDCGIITQIKKKEQEGEAKGGGAVAGAVIGALITREAVKGDHRNEAAAAGAIAGGVAGHQIEQEVRATDYYVFFVRMDKDDSIVKVKTGNKDGLQVGDKVRVSGNTITRR